MKTTIQTLFCFLALLFMSRLGAGCGYGPTANVHIGPGFTDEEAAMIEAAALEWFLAIPEASATIDRNKPYNVIRMSGESFTDDGNIISGRSARNRMWLWPDVSGDNFGKVALHEFGHWMGATGGDDGFGHVAAEDGGRALSYGGGWAHCISQEDIDSACEYRGCTGTPSCTEEDL